MELEGVKLGFHEKGIAFGKLVKGTPLVFQHIVSQRAACGRIDDMFLEKSRIQAGAADSALGLHLQGGRVNDLTAVGGAQQMDDVRFAVLCRLPLPRKS